MGLDMYLYIDKYVSRMNYNRDTDGDLTATVQPVFQAITEALGTQNLIREDDWTGYSVQVPVGYWRKANAVHSWIVNNCANGVDECQRIYVPREKAQELVDWCKMTIANPDKADEFLPTTSGFFFGSTEYDEWYLKDIQDTIDIFEPLLASEYGDSITYQASW